MSLCAAKSSEQVELLRLESSGIRVAEYLTELPPRPVLEKKLHDATLGEQYVTDAEHRLQRAAEEWLATLDRALRNK